MQDFFIIHRITKGKGLPVLLLLTGSGAIRYATDWHLEGPTPSTYS